MRKLESVKPVNTDSVKLQRTTTSAIKLNFYQPEGMYSHHRPAQRSTTLTTRKYRVTASRNFLDRHSIHIMSCMGKYLRKDEHMLNDSSPTHDSATKNSRTVTAGLRLGCMEVALTWIYGKAPHARARWYNLWVLHVRASSTFLHPDSESWWLSAVGPSCPGQWDINPEEVINSLPLFCFSSLEHQNTNIMQTNTLLWMHWSEPT